MIFFKDISLLNWSSDMFICESGRQGINNSIGNHDASENYNDTETALNFKADTKALIQKQFALRKAAATLKEEPMAHLSRVKFAQSTEIKIPGLNISIREKYLTAIANDLKFNYDSYQKVKQHFHKYSDFEEIGKSIEYSCFTSNKAISLYRRSISKQMLADIFWDKFYMTPNLENASQGPTIDFIKIKRKMMLSSIKKHTEDHLLFPNIENYVLEKKNLIGGDQRYFKEKIRSVTYLARKQLKKELSQQSLITKFLSKAYCPDEFSQKLELLNTSENVNNNKEDRLDNNCKNKVIENSKNIKEQNIHNSLNIVVGTKHNITVALESIKEENCNRYYCNENEKNPDLLNGSKENTPQILERSELDYRTSLDNEIRNSYGRTNNDFIPASKLIETKEILKKSSTKKRFHEYSKEIQPYKRKKIDCGEKNSEKKSKLIKAELADIVIQCLMPYYKEGKITSKVLFKNIARRISHYLYNTDLSKGAIKINVSQVLCNYPVVKSDGDIEIILKKISTNMRNLENK